MKLFGDSNKTFGYIFFRGLCYNQLMYKKLLPEIQEKIEEDRRKKLESPYRYCNNNFKKSHAF